VFARTVEHDSSKPSDRLEFRAVLYRCHALLPMPAFALVLSSFINDGQVSHALTY